MKGLPNVGPVYEFLYLTSQSYLRLIVTSLPAAFESIIGLLGPGDSALFASEDAKKTYIGLARDLRGLAFAFNTKTTYMMLFDWM